MAGPAAVKCYYSSGNAETLTRACMYNPPAHLTSLHINGHIICMLCNSVRCLGENVLYVCIQCFGTFWVSDIYITLARTRPPFAFRAVSNRGPLSGTVLTVMLDHFFKMEDLQVRWKSALNSALQNFKQLLHVFLDVEKIMDGFDFTLASMKPLKNWFIGVYGGIVIILEYGNSTRGWKRTFI